MNSEYDGVSVLLNAVTSTGAGDAIPSQLFPGSKTFQAVVEGSGAVTAEVDIEASNDGEHWLVLGTISLSGTGSDTDGFASSAAWAYHRANLTAVTGTGASVSVMMGA
jgi:hypothetical protein